MITIDASGLAALSERIKQTLDDKGEDLMELAAGVVLSRADRAFDEEAMRPAEWPPLKPATLAAKASQGLSLAPLKAHGLLVQSLKIQDIKKDSATVGAFAHYASYHQQGTAHIPPRPFLPEEGGELTTAADEEVGDVIAAEVARLITGA